MTDRRRLSEGVLVALITAGGTVTASVVTGGFGLANSGESKGSVSRPGDTVTVTAPAADSPAPAAPGPSAGAQYLSDMEPVGDSDPSSLNLQNVPVAVKGTTYQKSLVWNGHLPCWDSVKQDYVLSRRYRRFRASVGLADNTPDTAPLTFSVLADGSRVKTISSVAIAESRKVDISVAGVSRISLKIEIASCETDTSVGVWINPEVLP